MSADDMFIKLGYEIESNDQGIWYSKPIERQIFVNKTLERYIKFDLLYKRIRVVEEAVDAWNSTQEGAPYMSIDEVRAINKKMEELKWI